MTIERSTTLDKTRFKELLKNCEITQKELCEKLEITQEHLSRCITSGKISYAWLLKICEYLDVSPDYISGKDDENRTYLAFQRFYAIKDRRAILKNLFVLLGEPPEIIDEMNENEVGQFVTDIAIYIGVWKMNSKYYKKDYPTPWEKDHPKTDDTTP